MAPDIPTEPTCEHERVTDGCQACGVRELRKLERLMAEADRRHGRPFYPPGDRLLSDYELPE